MRVNNGPANPASRNRPVFLTVSTEALLSKAPLRFNSWLTLLLMLMDIRLNSGDEMPKSLKRSEECEDEEEEACPCFGAGEKSDFLLLGARAGAGAGARTLLAARSEGMLRWRSESSRSTGEDASTPLVDLSLSLIMAVILFSCTWGKRKG